MFCGDFRQCSNSQKQHSVKSECFSKIFLSHVCLGLICVTQICPVFPLVLHFLGVLGKICRLLVLSSPFYHSASLILSPSSLSLSLAHSSIRCALQSQGTGSSLDDLFAHVFSEEGKLPRKPCTAPSSSCLRLFMM